jgi:TonB-linked SusC/RagA family outer membrane protein
MKSNLFIQHLLIKIMKISVIQLIVISIFSTVATATTVHGQNMLDKRVTLSLSNVTLQSAFSHLEKTAEIKFSYNSRMAELTHKVNVVAINEKISDVLSKLLTPMNVSFVPVSNRIVIRKEEFEDQGMLLPDNLETPVVKPLIIEEDIIISGTVTDDKGEKMIGVNILEKGTGHGTVTDQNGNYSISVTNKNAILVFSFVGYKTEEILVGNKTSIDIILRSDITLEEVVVVGYGTKKKIHLTGAVSSITGKELTEAPVANLSNMIAGRLPGVIVTNPNGRPGSGSSVNIRGFSTLGNNNPLIVVDGIPRDGFSAFDPNEVESVTILKDASATAVYGARANNGVILVKTKRGVTGKPTITYTGSVGIQNPTNYPKMMNAEQFATTWNQALTNAGVASTDSRFYKPEQIAKFKSGEEGGDWYQATFQKNAQIVNHNITVNGGSDALKYFVSLAALDQGGMYKTIGYKAYKFRSNIDARINKTLTLGFDLEGRQENTTAPRVDANTIFEHVARLSPTFKAYYPSGRPLNNGGEHPGEEINNSGYNRGSSNIFQGTVSLNQLLSFITEGLSVGAKVSFGKQYRFGKAFSLPYNMYNEDANGNVTGTKGVGPVPSLSESFNQSNSTFYNLYLDYQRQFNKHSFTGLLLFEQFEGVGDQFSASRQDFPITSKDEFFVSGPTNQNISGSSFINDARRGVVGRLGYVYNDKYLFESSFRYDGSYIFPKGKQFGFFPSVSAGWRVSEEDFYKDSPLAGIMNNLKLKASWGSIGNDRVSAFQFIDAFTLTTSSGPFFNGVAQPLVYYGVYPNPNITWETADNKNVGFEAGFFASKLRLEFDYFIKDTRDILWSRVRSVPATFGRSLPSENYAQVVNKGFEVVLNYDNAIGQVRYRLGVNSSFAKNKVTVIDDPANALDFQKQQGKPLGYRIGYEALGFFQSAEEATSWMGGKQFGVASRAGDIKYADIDNNGSIDSKDQKVLSENTATPRVMYGFTGNFDYKGFDLSFLFQGAAARNFLISRNARVTFDGGTVNAFEYLQDAWSPTNTGAAYPQVWLGSRSINNQTSDVWLTNGAYLRLKSVNLGYSFNNLKWNNFSIPKIKLFVSGFNLATWSKITKKFGFDPEAESGAGNYYPQQSVYSVGANVSF